MKLIIVLVSQTSFPANLKYGFLPSRCWSTGFCVKMFSDFIFCGYGFYIENLIGRIVVIDFVFLTFKTFQEKMYDFAP